MTFCYFLKNFEKLKSSGALPPDFELVEVVQKYEKGKNVFRLAYGYSRNEDTKNAILWDLFGQAYRSKGVFNAFDELAWDEDEDRPKRVQVFLMEAVPELNIEENNDDRTEKN